MMSALAKNAAGLLATRFFLGATESLIAPAMTVLVSMFYKRSEQPLRHAAWFLGNTTAGLLGGLLNWAIGHIKVIAPWKGSYLILGGATVTWGIAAVFLVPDSPSDAWFLKGEDRKKVVIRIQDNLTGIKNNKFKWAQVKEALLDPLTWFLVCLQIGLNIPNGGVTTVRAKISEPSKNASSADTCFHSSDPSSSTVSASAPSIPCSCKWFPTAFSLSWSS